jgi:hypothetical protein
MNEPSKYIVQRWTLTSFSKKNKIIIIIINRERIYILLKFPKSSIVHIG